MPSLDYMMLYTPVCTIFDAAVDVVLTGVGSVGLLHVIGRIMRLLVFELY